MRPCQATALCGSEGHSRPWSPGSWPPLPIPFAAAYLVGVHRPTTHTCVFLSSVHAGCQPCHSPPAAPCSGKRCLQPEGRAWSCPGARGAAVRAGLPTGAAPAGRVAGELCQGPLPLPEAPATSCGCREILSYVGSTHTSVLKLSAGFRAPAACCVLSQTLCAAGFAPMRANP